MENTTTLHTQLVTLIEQFGEEAFKQAAAVFVGTHRPQLPAIPPQYLPIINATALHDTVLQLDASTQDIITKAKAREASYGDRLTLIKRKRELETAIELKEAEAIMGIRGEARSQYITIAGEKVMLANEEARKAYARTSSKTEREELAKLESELFQLEQRSFWAKDEYEAAVKAGDHVQAKAHLQGGLLHMLGNRG